MNNLDNLLSIAKDLNNEKFEQELINIKDRLNNPNSQIIVPIVGEFSSGKTTLINALSDNKKLETASKPTTSVVYEIYFGNEKETAELVYENGNTETIEDITSLKNDEFDKVELVRIFDTATTIPNSTVLVDTPGLSSNDPKHKEALSKYLPNSDALILCIDINQQITSSLLDFIQLNKLTYLPIYLVITKTDTKTPNELKAVKEYISKNIELPLDNIVSISATNNNLTEFYDLMNKIQKNKNEIIQKALNYKITGICEYLKNHIQNLLDNSENDTSINKKIQSQERELHRIKNSIDVLINDVDDELDDAKKSAVREFSRIVENKLENIIKVRGQEADQQAVGVINSTANIVLNNYKTEVKKKLIVLAQKRRNSELDIPLRSLHAVDIEATQMDSLTYDIDLGSAGKNTVKIISEVIDKGMYFVPMLGQVKAGTKIATTAVKVVKGINKVKEIAKELVKKDGAIEEIFGSLTDGVLGKPQRRKLINNYMENTLIPDFNSNISSITKSLLVTIQANLSEEAESFIEQVKNELAELKKLATENKEAFNEKKKKYKDYINLLNQ